MDGFVTQLSLPELTLTLEQLSFKKVPVVGQVSISYDVGFDALGAKQIKPDSVTITGSKKMLDTIFSVTYSSFRTFRYFSIFCSGYFIAKLAKYFSNNFSQTSNHISRGV